MYHTTTHYVVAKKMKRGFYYSKDEIDERCYYLTGEKSGNKWIAIGGINGDEFVTLPNPEWTSLNWMCLPTEEELKDFKYSQTNPTPYVLAYKQTTIFDAMKDM